MGLVKMVAVFCLLLKGAKWRNIHLHKLLFHNNKDSLTLTSFYFNFFIAKLYDRVIWQNFLKMKHQRTLIGCQKDVYLWQVRVLNYSLTITSCYIYINVFFFSYLNIIN